MEYFFKMYFVINVFYSAKSYKSPHIKKFHNKLNLLLAFIWEDEYAFLKFIKSKRFKFCSKRITSKP